MTRDYTASSHPSPQISVAELAHLLSNGSVKLIDASWALDGSDMFAPFLDAHIPGAQFFDLTSICDHGHISPHMAPTPEHFAHAVGNLGISDSDDVVIYDQQGLFSAPRIWWLFTLMGHKKVRVLKGGLPGWKAAGHAVTDRVQIPEPVDYVPAPRTDILANKADVLAALGKGDHVILDARGAPRFKGEADEPRPGLRSGHIPGSFNLPYADLIENGALKDTDELQAVLDAYPISGVEQIITTCGSGISAAILALALEEQGHHHWKLYDGSWAEWGDERSGTPIEKG